MLRLAMLGYWHVHARDYEREAREHPETEVVAVWDDDPARGAAAAQAIGATFVPDLDTLLADPAIDGVVVTTATSIHHAVMLAAATGRKGHLHREGDRPDRGGDARDRRGGGGRGRGVRDLSSPPVDWVRGGDPGGDRAR